MAAPEIVFLAQAILLQSSSSVLNHVVDDWNGWYFVDLLVRQLQGFQLAFRKFCHCIISFGIGVKVDAGNEESLFHLCCRDQVIGSSTRKWGIHGLFQCAIAKI